MDYTGKLLKALYEIVDLLKDIKKQNKQILGQVQRVEWIEKQVYGLEFVPPFNGGEEE